MTFTDRLVTNFSLYERVSKLLESYEYSDCIFLVDGQAIRAHKLLLGISSPVFKAMLYGPLSNSDSIVIKDIEYATFQSLLHYIYTDKVIIDSLKEACDLMYTAKKYLLESLAEHCLEFIFNNVSVDEVVSMYNFAEFIQEERLCNYCIVLISQHADYVFSNHLEQVSLPCIKTVLESDEVNIDEKKLINYALKWVELQCNELHLPLSFNYKRKILVESGIFQLLRFLCLSVDDMNEIGEILNTEEIDMLKKLVDHKNTKYDHENMNLNESLCCVRKPRCSMRVTSCICLRSIVRSAPPLVIGEIGNNIKTKLKSNKTVFIHSIGIPSRMTPSVIFTRDIPKTYLEQMMITITLETEKDSCKRTNFINTVNYDSTLFIDFSEPFVLTKNKWCIITLTWPEQCHFDCKYLLSFRSTEINCKTLFEFHDESDNFCGKGSFIEGIKFSL